MKKIYILLAIAALFAACSKPDNGNNDQDFDNRTDEAPTPGTEYEITVTLPSSVNGVTMKAAMLENSEGGFALSWKDGDEILIGGEVFTLVSKSGKTGKFKGKVPAAGKIDIVFPASLQNAAGYAAAIKTEAVQKSSGDISHLSYKALMKGVEFDKEIELGYGWAGSHGGSFSQTGCLKLVINPPQTLTSVKKVVFKSEGHPTMTLDITDGSLVGGAFAAYFEFPVEKMEFKDGDLIELEATDGNGDVYQNKFNPGPQTFYGSFVTTMETSPKMWFHEVSGKGSESDPYEISTADEFFNIHNILTQNTTFYFVQKADIDLSAYESWTPMNVVDEAFGIHYDGGNHKISGLKCSSSTYASIFGILHGTVKNLTVENPLIKTTANSPCGVICGWAGDAGAKLEGHLENVHVTGGTVTSSSTTVAFGGLCGRACNASFKDCSYDGIVERTSTAAYNSSYYPVGGIVGQVYDGVTISGCSSSGTLTTKCGRSQGGIVGLCSVNLDILNCHSTMNIEARDDVVGGIVGYYGNGRVEDCWVEGNLTVTTKGSGQSYLGGVVGHTAGDIIMKRCRFKGNIDGFSGIVGGILGQCNTNQTAGAEISECFSEGTLKGAAAIGGLVGRSANVGLKMTDCGTTMDVNGSSSYVGGAIGDIPTNTVIKNCWASGAVKGSFSIGGFAGRAFGRQGSSASLSTEVNTTVEGCIAFNPSVRTITTDGESATNHYSGGAVIGCSSYPNTLKNCWRNPKMDFWFYSTESLNTLFDHEDSDPIHPLVQPAGVDKWFSPYHGKAAAEFETVSAIAVRIGYDSNVWDLTGDLPVLKVFK